jgi:hypothetical protein
MNKNYIKIELSDSLPVVSMEYDSIESFQNLMFCLVSESGFNLIYKTIEKDLMIKNRTDEIEIMAALVSLVNKDVQDLAVDKRSESLNVIDPSSFK